MARLEVGSTVRVDWPETIYEGLHGVEGVVVKSNDHATLVRLAHGVEQWLSTPRLRQPPTSNDFALPGDSHNDTMYTLGRSDHE